jgi:hypothetical protein
MCVGCSMVCMSLTVGLYTSVNATYAHQEMQSYACLLCIVYASECMVCTSHGMRVSYACMVYATCIYVMHFVCTNVEFADFSWLFHLGLGDDPVVLSNVRRY